MSTQIIIKNTTGSTNPTLSYGELGICYKNGIEKLFAKNSLNEIFAFNDWSKIFNKPTSFDGYGITGGTLTGSITGLTATFLDVVNMKNGAVIESNISGSTVLDVQGTFGQLFSVTDNLIGDIFKVSDISGMPILNVNSDGIVSIYDNLFVSSGITSSLINPTNLTTNYLPKKTVSGLTDSLIYDSGTGVGIGTTSIGNWKFVVQSKYPLQIKDSSGNPVFEFYGDTKENRYLNGLSIVGYNQNLSIKTSNISNHILLQQSGGKVGIGTINPTSTLHLESDSGELIIRLNNIASGGRNWELNSKNSTGVFSILDRTASADRLIINSSGNVGIGTISPTNKLQVNGSAMVGNSTTGGLTIWNGTTGVTLTVDSNGNLRVGGNIYADGEVSAYGLGTTGGTGGGSNVSVLNISNFGNSFSSGATDNTFNAYAINSLYNRITNIEASGATSIETIGVGNAITSVSKTGNMITFNKGTTFLTQNQNITLTGDVTGSGNTSITTSISATTITSKLLTNYVVGSNSALDSTDSILSAFGKIQAQINARPGTVTSIGLTLPTGLQVSPSSITSAGTFAVTFTSGYSIPTTTKQGQWDTAYTNTHTHTNLSVLSGITNTDIINWSSAYSDTFSATSSNTSNTLVKRDGSGNFSANTITASLSGNASTATKLSSTRTFQLTGDVTGTITSDLSTGATISTTIAANSVALGADTTGNYAGSISVSGSGLSLSGSAGEGTNYTITSNATSNNVPSTIVYRDSSGDFVAGSIIAEESFNYSTNAYTTYNSITKTIDFVFN